MRMKCSKDTNEGLRLLPSLKKTDIIRSSVSFFFLGHSTINKSLKSFIHIGCVPLLKFKSRLPTNAFGSPFSKERCSVRQLAIGCQLHRLPALKV
jgi:hypothetical protein